VGILPRKKQVVVKKGNLDYLVMVSLDGFPLFFFSCTMTASQVGQMETFPSAA
jgi:hypothetical protein